MSSPPLQLPTLQNWSCHNCSGCCRQHLIEVTPEERRRIEAQGWSAADGPAFRDPVFVWHAGPPWKKRYRLAHQPDGACVFLDERGLCRIHAKHGESAKPLACRIYPYAFHPGGKQVTVSVRFSCPSIVANRGKPLRENAAEIKRLAAAVVPANAGQAPPPAVSPGQRVDWPDLLRFVDALDETLSEAGAPLIVRLVRALRWTRLVGQAKFESIRGPRLEEFLLLVREAARHEVADLGQITEPSPLGRMQFRLLVAQYARRDTVADLSAGWRGRWRLLRSAVRFTRGSGNALPLQEAFREAPFAAMERPFGGLPPQADEILARYLRVKVRGLHFCGRAYYDVPLVEGFQSLALAVAAVLYLARWLAAGDGRGTLADEDVARALAIADHHHGYSAAFGQRSFRRRVRLLDAQGQIEKLCRHYSK